MQACVTSGFLGIVHGSGVHPRSPATLRPIVRTL
jgi:hypothetical protein